MGQTTISPTVSHYDVKKGDSLWKIAAEHLGKGTDANDLAKLNGISPNDKLSIGQRLIVPNYQRSDLTANYMLLELTNNAKSQEAQAIADAIARSKSAKIAGDEALADIKKAEWYQIFRVSASHSTFETMVKASGVAMTEAKARWFIKVRQDGPWDHKPLLRKKYNEMSTPPRPFGSMDRAYHFPIRGDLFHEYYYDVWSNIHYGYVGARCGFDEKTLQEGAASGLPGVGDNDEGDVISVKIGIDLWRNHGFDLTAALICKAITSRASDYLAARSREISKGMKPEEANNVVISNNDYK